MKAKSASAATAEFLLEVGCEEIPAGMILSATNELQVILSKYLGAENLLNGKTVETFGAPRRLVATCSALRVRQDDVTREVTGPPKSVAFSPEGHPTRAAESFASKQGVEVAALYTVSTPRGEYVATKQVIVGRPAIERLKEILPRAVAEIPWPKTMYWTGATGLRFIRPIRWVVALLGKEVVRFDLADVKSGAATTGHRFLGKAQVPVTGAKDYVEKLRKNFVLARPEERRLKVERELARLATKKSLRVNQDLPLVDMVTYLNEYPTVIMGDFDESYLALPEEILITVMRGHQKYFALRKRDGRLAPHFLAVINLDRDRGGLIQGGHERVLRARFADARFFWQEDQKCRLADYLPELSRVTFQVKLGSYGEKVERVRALARWLAEQWFARGIHEARVADADRAAELAKCDLVTKMVGEFPELQGVVGGLYAEAQEESEEVAHAVYDHYRPVGLDDPIPRNLTGSIVALADKMDTLVGCFTVGLTPTGSSDPFALRRAALGIVKIVLERKLPLSLGEFIAAAGRGLLTYPPKLRVAGEVERQITEFLLDRTRYILKERHSFAYDEINAALAAGADDLVDAVERISALRDIRKTKNFEPLAVSFKRIRNILEKAGPRDSWILPTVRTELFQEDAERRLHSASRRIGSEAEAHRRAGKYREALQRISTLRPEVDDFFDSVMVMVEQEEVRKNRLTLLSELLREVSTIADFSELVPTAS